MEKYKDTGYISQDMQITQGKVGAIAVNAFHYSDGDSHDIKIRILKKSNREPFVFDEVFTGNLADLIALIERAK